jgi:hypothetical protein
VQPFRRLQLRLAVMQVIGSLKRTRYLLLLLDMLWLLHAEQPRKVARAHDCAGQAT